MAEQRLLPQLVMRRCHLRDLPAAQVPEGYELRHFREGDEGAWERIIRASFGNDQYEFEKVMKSDPAFRPQRVLFIVRGDEPVATASAWQVPRFGPNTGVLHMVGALPGHRGKRLGFWVSLAALYQFISEGRIDAVLQTDDFRLAAVKTYLRLGFEPLLVHENQRRRWREAFERIGRPELAEQFRSILEGPTVKIEGLRGT